MLIASLFLCCLPAATEAPGSTGIIRERSAVVADDPALETKLTAAGRDIPKLLELASACTTAGSDADAKKVYRKVLEIDANNESAHKALNHQFYDKKWFESFAELAKYKRDEAARMKAKGLARFKEEWVPEGDLPFLNMGWPKDEHGKWVNPADVAHEKEIAEKKAAKCEFRWEDSSWVAPEDFPHWTAHLWKCGDEWVELAKANEYHAKIETDWEIDGEHFVVEATCDWATGNLARGYAENAYPELVRLFGIQPKGKPHFVVLSSLAQYNQASGGTPPLLPESEGFSSLHGGYFADGVFDFGAKPPQFQGAGVCYWDTKVENLNKWGGYFARWAAAQSFIDAIDPSWNFIGETIASASGTGARPDATAFWAEKKIPRWLRYGAASYVERYMKNPDPTNAKPWDLRGFEFADVKKAGGLHKLDEIFAFALDITKLDNSMRLYQEVGVLVSFMLDGAPNDKKLAADLGTFRTALKSGTKAAAAAAVTALQKDLIAHEREIKVFAGL